MSTNAFGHTGTWTNWKST